MGDSNDAFDEVILSMVGAWEAEALDFLEGEFNISFTLEQRPDLVFTLIAEKAEVFEENQRLMLN